MGCSISYKVNRAISSNVSADQHTGGLTDRDKQMIRKTWPKVSKDLLTFGAKVFTMIIHVNPHMKDLFPWQGSTEEELLSDARFRQHAERFSQVISSAAENVNTFDDVITPSLITLGEHHVDYVNFSEEYYEIFSASILKVIEEELDSKLTDDVSEAWCKLVKLMTSKIKEGHLAKS